MLSTEYDDQRAGEEAKREVAADARAGARSEGAGARRRGRPASARRTLPARAFVYEFRVVDQWPPNAFALPGGAIYVSRGLLVLSNSEDELANVLAHEIMHAAARHAAARQAVAGGVNPFAMAFTNPAYLAAYSRDQEREADRGGQSLAAAAGYDPAGMNDFLASLGNVEKLLAGASRMPGYLRHAPADQRARRGDRDARAAPRLDPTARCDARPRRLPAPPRTAWWWARIRPRASSRRAASCTRISTSCCASPTAGRFVNSPAAVGAVSPDGRARVMLELAGEGADPAVFADDFLAQRAAEIQAQIEARRALTINGLPAVEIRGSAPGPSGAVAGKHHLDRARRARLPARQSRAGPRRGARPRRAATSSRAASAPLTPEDRAGIRVRRLRLATAHAGESLADFSSRTGNDWDAQRTAIANGLFASARLSQGQLLKIAVLEPYAPSDAPEPAPR